MTTLGVAAPGRWILASAAGTTGEAGRGSRRAAQRRRRRHQPQQHEYRQRRGDEDRGDAPVVGERDGDAGERAADQRGCDDVGPARPVPLTSNSSRNSAETGTSWARPSGHSAKAAAVRSPYSRASASKPDAPPARAAMSRWLAGEAPADEKRQGGADREARQRAAARTGTIRDDLEHREPVAPSALSTAIRRGGGRDGP